MYTLHTFIHKYTIQYNVTQTNEQTCRVKLHRCRLF